MRYLILTILIISTTGCTTLGRFSDEPDLYIPVQSIYPATKVNFEIIKSLGNPFGENVKISEISFSLGPLGLFLGIVELPFSLVFDTLFLPFDLHNMESKE